MSVPHAIDMYLSGGHGSHYVNKGGKYDIKWVDFVNVDYGMYVFLT